MDGKKRKILLDCTTLSKKTDGLTQYTLSILLEMLKVTDSNFLIIYRYDELPANYLNEIKAFEQRVELEIVKISPIGPKRDYEFLKWLKNNKNRFDFFYEPSAQYPIGIIGGVYTVHDILYEEYPEKLGRFAWLKKIYLHHVVRRGLKKARTVIAVSQFTKDEICKYHGENFKDKIHVVYEGYEHLQNIKILKNDNFIKNYLKINEQFFLYIGSSRGHKNLHNLFLAYKKAAVNWKLVVIGRMDRLEDSDKELVNIINKEERKIIFTDWIEDNIMYTILSKASAFIFPSKSEGFGIPILEAWFFNIPLLCSDIPVFNEIAKDGCFKFFPLDTDNIACKLKEFIKLSDLEKQSLIEKQNSYLKHYSWKKTATKIATLLLEQNY